MKFYLYKLSFSSPFHAGERENILEKSEVFIHSDTLFSAFCHSYLLLYGKKRLEELLKRFQEEDESPFRISSAFPWEGEKFYFPLPLNEIPCKKDFKKVRLVEKSVWEELLKGKKLEEMPPEEMLPPPTEGRGNIPWKETEVPRVSLSRLSQHPGGEFFHFGEVYFKENAGLFFLVEFKENDFKKEFEATLRLMSQEGIGGDRTVGKGFFEMRKSEEIDFNLPEGEKGMLTLSLYSPREEEIKDLKEGFYEIKERSGYIFSPEGRSFRRKSVRMFAEGSVFPSSKKGKLVEVTPEIFKNKHPVYRYGICFPLPCKLRKEE